MGELQVTRQIIPPAGTGGDACNTAKLPGTNPPERKGWRPSSYLNRKVDWSTEPGKNRWIHNFKLP